MDQCDNSNVEEEDGRSINQNKPLTLADIELETSDDHSQDLFNDDESLVHNSPSINFDTPGIVPRIINTPSTVDLLASLTKTPKFEKEISSYSDHPTVPTIPSSLVPFITTVNESWTSDLETPQAKSTDQASLRHGNLNGQLSASCEIMERKACGSARLNGVIPDVTTPSGCFIAKMENEGFSTSPILNTMIKRRKPKRRILKSLNDPSLSIDTSTDFAEVCCISADDYAANKIQNLEPEIDNTHETPQKHDPSAVINSTFVIDSDSLLHNVNDNLIQEETDDGDVVPPREGKISQFVKNSVQDKIVTENNDEICLMNERLQDCDDSEEIGSNESGKDGEGCVTSDSVNAESRGDKPGEKSLIERFREIKELKEKNEEYIIEQDFADIPIDVFTRGAKALESAVLVSRTPPSKSTSKKQWGLISFTEMCLLEQQNCDNVDSNIKETNNLDLEIKSREISCNLKDDKVTITQPIVQHSEIDEDMVDIFASSFNDKETEPAIEFDEFSPWFYQSQHLNDVNTKGNIDENKNDSEKVERCKNVVGNRSKSEANLFTNSKTSGHSTGFSTAGGKPIEINADKLKAAARLYDDIVRQDGTYCDIKMVSENPMKEQMYCKKNASILKNSSSSVGFCATSGKPIKIDEDKLKATAQLYDQIILQDGEPCDSKILPEVGTNKQSNYHKNETVIPQASSTSLGFATASGKPIKINEDKLKAATKLYDQIALQDGNRYDAIMLSELQRHQQSNKQETKVTKFQNSRTLLGFSMANEKPVIIGEDKLKAAAELYHETAQQDRKTCDSMLPAIQSDQQRKYEKNEASIWKNSSSPVGFCTASGMPIKINEDKLKAATQLYDRILLEDGKPWDSEILPGVRKDKQIIFQDTSNSMGFATASGKPIKINENKLKAATKLYDELAQENGKYYAGKNQRNERNNCKKEEATISENFCTSVGFSTASGKPININEDELEAAARLYEEVSATDNLQRSINFPQVPEARGVKRRHDSYTTDSHLQSEESSSFGFTTASGKPLVISESAMKKARVMYQSNDISESQTLYKDCSKKQFLNPGGSHQITNENTSKSTEFFDEASQQADSISDIQRTRRLTCLKNLSKIDCQTSPTKVNETLPGFSTASGKAIQISEQALSNAKAIFTEEDERCKSRKSSNLAGIRNAVGFSITNDERTKISADVSLRANKLFSAEQENTPPHHSLLKRSTAEMENPAKGNVSPENLLSEEITPVLTKKVRYNCDSLARKLFSEKGGDTDEEIEFHNKTSKDNRGSRTPLTSSNNCGHNLLTHEQKKNVSSVTNGTVGMYAKSEMFKMNDRQMIPKLKPQKTWPTNHDIGITESAGISSDNVNPKSLEVQKDRIMSTVSEEITASTEALLADEETLNVEKSWAAAITCSPTMMQDKEISAQSIKLKADCRNSIRERPTSPIIGVKFRARKKNKRRKRNLLKEDGVNIRNTNVNGCSNMKEDFEDQIVTQDSQQSSSVATPSSSSSKGSNRNISPVIEAALVSKLQQLVESSTNIEFHNNELESRVQLTPTEMGDRVEADDFLENRIAAILNQEKKIAAKKKSKPKPIPGSLLLRKTENRELRMSWQRATNGVAPTPKTPCELLNLSVQLDVMAVTAATAICYKFKCSDFYSKDKIRASSNGFEVGDGAQLIPDENGYAGATEFESAFLASPGVDPNLLHEKWVENHYRWIVWKLASMDRMKFGDLSLPRMLTPNHVMEQLKYRYDREIDKSQRPALRRIIEKDDPPSRRMILCVANITKFENVQALEKSPKITPTYWKVELTDGWYSITATIDSAMSDSIASGKVKEGTKLITSRAELLNCEQGCFPLEMLSDVSLKIHTNSTRRARWDAKLGFCKHATPIPTSLSAILSNGGLIGKLNTTIARVYPLQYFEKTWSGQCIFRNNKCEDKAVMTYEKERQAQIDTVYAQVQAKFEARGRRNSRNDDDPNSDQDSVSQKKVQRSLSYSESSQEAFQAELESALRNNLPPPRKVTLVLKVRVMDGENLGILTLWAPSEDIIDLLKEGNRVSIHNVQTSGKRSGELQLTAGHQSFVKPEGSIVSPFPRRFLTPIPEVAVAGFNPPFGEFDTVGMVVSLGPAPHGMRNFEVVSLAYPNPDQSVSGYLSILFWEGIGAYGFSDILTVGSTVACTNLQWRRGAPRTIPMAYSTEHSTFTRNPRQVYLRSGFDFVKSQIMDPASYVSQCAAEVAIEHQKKTNILRSPAVHNSSYMASPCTGLEQDKLAPGMSPRTPQSLLNSEKNTPAKHSVQRRLEKLQWYGEPPDLSPVTLNHSSSKVKQNFIPLVKTPEHL